MNLRVLLALAFLICIAQGFGTGWGAVGTAGYKVESDARTARMTRYKNAEKAEEDEIAERQARTDVAERGERAERTERSERGTRAERGERADRAERGERGLRGERADRGERGERSERGERGERAERGERGESAERGERAERSERAEMAAISERRDRNDRALAATRQITADIAEGTKRNERVQAGLDANAEGTEVALSDNRPLFDRADDDPTLYYNAMPEVAVGTYSEEDLSRLQDNILPELGQIHEFFNDLKNDPGPDPFVGSLVVNRDLEQPVGRLYTEEDLKKLEEEEPFLFSDASKVGNKDVYNERDLKALEAEFGQWMRNNDNRRLLKRKD